MSCLDLFPQLGHPVLTEGGIDLPQMQVWMVAIPPARELTYLEAIALLSGLAAGAAALADEPLDQQRVAPEDSAGLGCIKKATYCQLRLARLEQLCKHYSREEIQADHSIHFRIICNAKLRVLLSTIFLPLDLDYVVFDIRIFRQLKEALISNNTISARPPAVISRETSS